MVKNKMKKSFKFERSINSLLYALKAMGGRCDMHKLCKIMYFADRKHLSEYGRSVTGDTYIAMQYGPVPSCIDDILKALRGDSFFSSSSEIKDIKETMTFENRFIVKALRDPDLDELSGSDIKCLDAAIQLCREMTFDQLTAFSHGLAWGNTQRDRAMSIKDILREAGDDEEYVEYIAEDIKLKAAFL